MKLKIDSWHAKFYMKSYGVHYLPEWLCNYFWQLVLAIVLLPITWWTYFSNRVKHDSLLSKTIISLTLCSLFIGVGFLTFFVLDWDKLFTGSAILNVICLLISTGILMCSILGIVLWIFINAVDVLEKWLSRVIVFRKQLKKKNRTKIDWEYGEQVH